MSELREAAQAVVNQWNDDISWGFQKLIDRLQAALAQPETAAQPVMWQVRRIDLEEGHGRWCETSDPEAFTGRKGFEVRPLYVANGG